MPFVIGFGEGGDVEAAKADALKELDDSFTSTKHLYKLELKEEDIDYKPPRRRSDGSWFVTATYEFELPKSGYW